MKFLPVATVLLIALVAGSTLRGSEDGFAPILDKDHTDGWTYVGQGEMAVRDGVATTSLRDGLYWFQKTWFADFTLKLEFSVDSTNANSGIFIRFPDPGKDFNVATQKGYEIDIFGKETGSIVFQTPGAGATTIHRTGSAAVLLGAWNEFEITASGQRLVVKLNGEVVNDCTGRGSLSGYVGLQTNVGDGLVHFRNVRVKAGAPLVSTQKSAADSWKNTYWNEDTTLPAGIYQSQAKKIEVTKGRRITVSPGCMLEGGTFNSDGDVVWDVQGSLLRGTHFEDTLGAKFMATDSLFDGVEMNKTGGWFVDHWSTRWTFENCVLTGKFMRSELGVTDYSLKANRCTFTNLNLPKLKYKKDPAEEAQSNDLKFSNCRFIRCEVPESFLASTIDCVFEDCGFSDKHEDWSKANRPITVTAYLTGHGAPPKSYENGILKVTFKSTAPPENGSTLPFTFVNGNLALPTIRTMGTTLALGTIDNKPPPVATPAPSRTAAPTTPLPSQTSETQATTATLVKTYRNSLVFVTGTNGSGSGFLAKYKTGNFLFTNAHVAAGVKGAAFKSLEGSVVKIGAASCAVGHDIFLLQATTNGQPLELMQGVDENASIGDDIVVLGNAEGAGVINTITGKIVGLGPQLVEVDAPFQPGNSGSPIIHLKSGKVIGVATYAVIRKYDPATKEPVKDPVIRRFGYRLDSIKSWQPVNWPSFFAQAAEMEAIEKLTGDLAAFLNELASKSKVSRTNDNPAIKNRIDAWHEARAKRLSPRDASMADQSLLSFLKVTCQSDVTAARQHLTYDYFQRDLVDQQRERDEISKVFDEIIQNIRQER